MGPHPAPPTPHTTLIPTVNIGPAKGWPAGAAPAAAAGLAVNAFANGLDHPSWLYVVANGDVHVAEGNAPERRPLVAEDVGTQSGKSMLRTLANRLGAQTGALWALVIQAP